MQYLVCQGVMRALVTEGSLEVTLEQRLEGSEGGTMRTSWELLAKFRMSRRSEGLEAGEGQEGVRGTEARPPRPLGSRRRLTLS